MPEQIVIEIAPNGTIKIDAKNFAGENCEEAIGKFQKALGRKTGGGKKPEFFAPNPRREKQTVKTSG